MKTKTTDFKLQDTNGANYRAGPSYDCYCDRRKSYTCCLCSRN